MDCNHLVFVAGKCLGCENPATIVVKNGIGYASVMSVGDTIKERYGEDWYHEIGKRGGQAKVAKGFSKDPDLARWAGRKGGKAPRRKK